MRRKRVILREVRNERSSGGSSKTPRSARLAHKSPVMQPTAWGELKIGIYERQLTVR